MSIVPSPLQCMHMSGKISVQLLNKGCMRANSLFYVRTAVGSTKIKTLQSASTLDDLYDDMLDSAQTLCSPTAKIYQHDFDGKKEYIEDLGDLVDALDEKHDNADEWNFYMETPTASQASTASTLSEPIEYSLPENSPSPSPSPPSITPWTNKLTSDEYPLGSFNSSIRYSMSTTDSNVDVKELEFRRPFSMPAGNNDSLSLELPWMPLGSLKFPSLSSKTPSLSTCSSSSYFTSIPAIRHRSSESACSRTSTAVSQLTLFSPTPSETQMAEFGFEL